MQAEYRPCSDISAFYLSLSQKRSIGPRLISLTWRFGKVFLKLALFTFVVSGLMAVLWPGYWPFRRKPEMEPFFQTILYSRIARWTWLANTTIYAF